MTYAPDGKRVTLTDSSGTRKFLYDGNDVIQEYNSDWSTVTKEYTHGPWVDEPLSMTDKTAKLASSTYYLMKDRLGSIINILDANEALKTTYSYVMEAGTKGERNRPRRAACAAPQWCRP